ncbi:hypothetical protein NQ318_009320 [Aromia moschata]|uniref:Dynein light chain 1, axonemal n=1 Tax=Aromia moschata TaxID=1265417 RepID=A0AAV8XFD1_9CUCU|nr:hypothetical protein NQ318_009320 [Aromia moschata]
MAKATTIKEAIKKWEEKHPGEDIAEATDVGFQFQWLPIEKMDNSLSALVKCEKLSLSTNMIEKIAGLSALKNLKILSLGRNYIKNVAGLGRGRRYVGGAVDIVQYNREVEGDRSAQESSRVTTRATEFRRPPFCGNPLVENMDPEAYKAEVAKRLPRLKKLDGEPIFRDEGD